MNNDIMESAIVQEKEKSKFLLGVLGAIVGALLGGVIWVLIYQLGYIAYIAGVAIIYLSYKGYTLITKKNETKGLITSIIISVVVMLIAVWVSWSLVFSSELGITFFEASAILPVFLFDPAIIAEDSSIIFEFCKEIVIGLLLIGLGSWPQFRAISKGNQPAAVTSDDTTVASVTESAEVAETVEAP